MQLDQAAPLHQLGRFGVERLRFRREASRHPDCRQDDDHQDDQGDDHRRQRTPLDVFVEFDQRRMRHEGEQDSPCDRRHEGREQAVQFVGHHGQEAEEEELDDAFAIHGSGDRAVGGAVSA